MWAVLYHKNYAVLLDIFDNIKVRKQKSFFNINEKISIGFILIFKILYSSIYNTEYFILHTARNINNFFYYHGYTKLFFRKFEKKKIQ